MRSGGRGVNDKIERKHITTDSEWLIIVSDALDKAVRDHNGNVTMTDEIAKEISERMKMIAMRLDDKKSDIPPSLL